ncbi:MAG TPA: hypothetical protein DHW61_15520 [Lachnoclostridium phytofermentans]|uniref:Uncharacterized protein n=1 Tax=Lachnoclostridium phytofermentans TaxID=66219 RepID=A0A3D2X9G5_9FIRM|nr:hypothetical protein [Lachnoclostridium phytofermentans]
MDIATALRYMKVEKAIELESRRFFTNADETINTISIHAMRKQIPVKPKVMQRKSENEKLWWYCGSCGASRITGSRSNYCSYCGQRVDWSEHLENSNHLVPSDIMIHAKMEFPELQE